MAVESEAIGVDSGALVAVLFFIPDKGRAVVAAVSAVGRTMILRPEVRSGFLSCWCPSRNGAALDPSVLVF